MSPGALNPSDWPPAPADDGGVVVVPSAEQLAALVEANCAARRSAELRLAGDFQISAPSGAPVIMTGHQPEFFHAGVWAKEIVATRLAAAIGGRAEFLCVDSDLADGVRLRWPEQAGGDLRVASAALPAEVQAGRGVPFENLADCATERWRAWWGAVAGAGGRGTPLEQFVSAFVAEDGDYTSRFLSGVAAATRGAGETPAVSRRVSELSRSAAGAAWSAFCRHCLLNGGALFEAYNGALAAHRARRRIRGRQHPVPDLRADAAGVESPFWVYQPGGPRERLSVRPGAGAVELWAAGERIGALPDRALSADGFDLAAALEPWRLRPRALLLTTFARLALCDLFIHGLGGAIYDAITDDLIRRFFRIEPPAYACVTATLRLELPRRPGSAADLRVARREIRDRVFNPQRWLGPAIEGAAARAALRARTVAIEASERLRAEARNSRAARRSAWGEIGAANRALAELLPDGGALQQRVAVMQHDLQQNSIANDREWFFGLHSSDKLARLCERLPRSSDFMPRSMVNPAQRAGR
ncbi:MAG: hypothetical protein U1A27_09945 [Phycisphaerae bacterium]